MDDETIRRLNAINRQFYATVADEFDTTRGRAWAGWERLISYLAPLSFFGEGSGVRSKTISVLDVGCGNGRFGVFLREKFGVVYHGMDNSPALLDHARVSLPDATFEERDIVENPPDSGAYDLVVLFGVLHHIPGADRRLALMRQLAERVNPGGLLIFAAWRFYEYPRFRDRITAWDSDLQVEAGDYLLDWRRGEWALRYCHYVDDAEQAQLVAATGLNLVTQYRADGSTGDANLYTVMKNVNSLEQK